MCRSGLKGLTMGSNGRLGRSRGGKGIHKQARRFEKTVFGVNLICLFFLHLEFIVLRSDLKRGRRRGRRKKENRQLPTFWTAEIRSRWAGRRDKRAK